MIEFPFPPRNATPEVRDWMSKLLDALNERFKTGSGTPESVVTANPGCIFQRTDGGAVTSIYIKTSGTGNTGWTAK